MKLQLSINGNNDVVERRLFLSIESDGTVRVYKDDEPAFVLEEDEEVTISMMEK